MANDDTIVVYGNGQGIRLKKDVAISLGYYDGQHIRPEEISTALKLNAHYSIAQLRAAGETRPRSIPYDSKAYFRRWYK